MVPKIRLSRTAMRALWPRRSRAPSCSPWSTRDTSTFRGRRGTSWSPRCCGTRRAPAKAALDNKTRASSVWRIESRTPEIVIAVVAVVLLGAGAVLGKSGSSGSRAPKPAAAQLPSQAHIQRIEREVERIRGLRFKRPIRPKVVTPAVARGDALGDLDETYPAATRRADEELLTLLGLIPAGTDVRKLLEAISGEQVAGYYDPRKKTLRIVSGNGVDSPALVDVTLAHELTHALEDQRFGLKEPKAGTDDEASARTALLEGTAVTVQSKYTRCCV